MKKHAFSKNTADDSSLRSLSVSECQNVSGGVLPFLLSATHDYQNVEAVLTLATQALLLAYIGVKIYAVGQLGDLFLSVKTYVDTQSALSNEPNVAKETV